HVGMFETLPSNPNAFQAAKPLRVTDPLCSARKTLAAFCLSLSARNERGESRREGKLTKIASSPRPSPPFWRRRGREKSITAGARPSAFAARHSAASARRRSGRFTVLTSQGLGETHDVIANVPR